ncbi:hypothetical protein SLE2022_071350 [Rubroshorea leprosula]
METLYPALCMATPDWFHQEGKNTNWTKEENKLFESALAIYGEETPDRWLKVAEMTGKTVQDVLQQYKELEDDVCEIEAGRFPTPGYYGSSFTLELVNSRDYDGFRKKPAVAMARNSDQERKKGVPWTEDEHRRFLLGLLKYGKGDWRNISRNFVVSKTPTQVASHAQKYYQRQLSGGKDKRRPSIHDITTVNLTNTCFSDNHKGPSLDQVNALVLQQKLASMTKVGHDWSHLSDGSGLVFNSSHGNRFVSSPYDIKLQGQSFHGIAYHGAHIKPHNSVF